MLTKLETAILAALQAGKSILEIYYSGEFDVEMKGDKSPLTKADITSHNVIISFFLFITILSKVLIGERA